MLNMILSLNCKDAGDPVCTHRMYGETEDELPENARNMVWKFTSIQKSH
jgi:hypothetical protein